MPFNGWTASLNARDILGMLDAQYYKGVFPENEESLYTLAERVLQEAKLPKYRNGHPRWILDDSLWKITTKAPLPSCSMAECLQLIASAGCCSMFFDREGRLHMEPLKDTYTDGEYMIVDEDHSYSKAEINTAKQIKRFDVSYYDYTGEGEPGTFTTTLELSSGNNEIFNEFPDLYKDAEVVVTVNGEPVKESEAKNGVTLRSQEIYAKSCSLVIYSEGEEKAEVKLTVNGKVIKPVEFINNIANNVNGEILSFKNNTLITSKAHTYAVGEWLKENMNRRMKYSLDLRVDPSLETGDIFKIVDDAGKEKTILVTSSGFSFNGAFKGKYEGVAIDG